MPSPLPRSARPRRAVVAVGLAAALALTGCGDESQEQGVGPDAGTDADSGLPAPAHAEDDTVRLTIGLVSPANQQADAPISADGELLAAEDGPTVQEREIARTESFGCQDTVSIVRTVPMLTDDPLSESLRFIVGDTRTQHGDPAFSNPLANSEDLSLESASVDGDTVTVELGGEISTRGACESWQLLEQLDATARAAAGVDEAEVLIDGEPLSRRLGLGDDVADAALRPISG
ncbi:GerMN domain-containing protein [Nesterenkonia sp. F]|uniref:GerMN domain-containing protein n=1 Tax=Nesterenkonia sp. F TaxID=795955 RepID=UPI000255C8A4|nr:GerMN domain-containing protein [Nesterenkonia sp. F]